MCGVYRQRPNDYMRQCLLEPWWEKVKHHIRTRACLCSEQEWTRDGRNQESVSHDSDECRAEHRGQAIATSQDGSRPRHGISVCVSAGSSDEINALQFDPESPSTKSITRNTPYEHVSRSDRDSDYDDDSEMPFELLLRGYYELYGPWKGDYGPEEYYCLRCFARVEEWDTSLLDDDTYFMYSDSSEEEDTSEWSTGSEEQDDSGLDTQEASNACSEVETESEDEDEEDECVDPMGVD
ncbi:hypothetical protein BJY04DRAFT_183533 [Aspergillus karnatakaensis]|uniref:uncharacterized protein n=1 Tax=Aspergillus karnatakaensis TaxID=1810916 RepID=UPI003CCCFAF4